MNYNADGPIVVWHDYGCEGWQPRSYAKIADAIAGGIESGDAITIRLPLERIVNEPGAILFLPSPQHPELP